MPQILTSWKEISRYLGKGVRTVQRWEREAGLPVRRQTEPSPHAVIAIADELEAWARSRTRGPAEAQAGALRREIAALRAENGELRTRLGSLEAAVAAMSGPAVPSANGGYSLAPGLRVEEETTIRIERRVVPVPGSQNVLPGAGAGSHEIRFAARQARAQAVRARLSFAFLLCALLESRVHEGDAPSLQRAENSALAIHRSLESPGYVPADELNDLRRLLRKLAWKIDCIARGAIGEPDCAASQSERGELIRFPVVLKMEKRT
jgi:hypothetical protein